MVEEIMKHLNAWPQHVGGIEHVGERKEHIRPMKLSSSGS